MKYIYWCLILIALIACKQPGNNYLNAESSNPIPDSIYYFFPADQSVYRFSQIPFDITERCNNPSGCCKLLAVVSKKNIDLDSLTDFSKKNSIQILYDTSELVILKDRDFDKRDFLDSSYANAQISNIIPDFKVNYVFENGEDIWIDSTTNTGLKPGYTLYVIKSGSSLILNEKWDCTRKWLPPQLRHGYRSGIAINPDNEYVIFWCVAW